MNESTPRALARIACFLSILFAATVSSAQQDPNAASEPQPFGGPDDDSGYEVEWYPAASVSGPGKTLGVVRNRLSGDVPVWFKDGDAVMMSLSVDQSHFSGEAELPETLRVFPSDLWKIQVGVKHMHQFSSGSSSMLMFDVESASDKPFQSSRDIKYTLGGFYRKPAKNGRDSWMLGAIYSPMGWPNFPIPLVAYNWHPSDRLQMNIGLPLSINWKPTKKVNVDLSLGPSGADALTNVKLSDRLQAYGGYQQIADQYFLSGRPQRDDALFAVEQRLLVGFRRNLRKGMKLDFSAGYAFDRHYGEGEDQQDLRDRVNLESSVFVRAKFLWDF